MADTLTIEYGGAIPASINIDPTNSATATGVGAKEGLIGPPKFKEPHTQGRFIRQTTGASGTYRWLADERLDNTVNSPTTFLYVGIST